MKNILSKNILPHLIVLGAFLALIFIYFSPVLSGKKMVQNDVVQSAGTLKEANTYQEASGEEILWSNTSFSGMPVWRGFNSNVLNQFHYFFATLLPIPVLLSFLGFVGFYILLRAYRLDPWLSGIGAFAYTFCTFNMVSIEAGHINKVFDMALMAPVLGGLVLVFRGKYWIGSGVTILSSALQIYYGHLQITYYLLFIVLFYIFGEFIYFLRNKNLKDFFKAIIILMGCAIVSVAPNFSKLYTNAEYVKHSTRGGSELSSAQNKEGGLDKEYALSWSSGVIETMTLFIPSLYGGSSHEDIGQDSETYKTLLKNGVPKSQAKEFVQNAPFYWGDQPFTSGPVYVGAIVCFLFILGIILIKGSTKWWILSVSVLAIMLAWGKNFEPLTDLFLNYVPLYNKFRSVTMIFSIVQVTFTLLAFIVLQRIVSEEINKQEIIKGLKISAIITGGLALFFTILGGGIFEFTSEGDKNLPVDWLLESLKKDRESRLRGDALRSFIFVLLTATALWTFLENKIKKNHLYGILFFLILLDIWTVDKRYLNKDDFKYSKDFEKKVFVSSPANELILQDSDPNFKVFNLTVNPFNDATTSYFHKSIGGYSAIKLGRYQELIEHHLSKNNMAVLNMLNTKYFIVPDKQTQEPFVQRNPSALGNAWLIDSIRIVKNADEEIQALSNFNPATTAIIDQRFSNYLNGFEFKPSAGNIQLTSYHPNRLNYKSNTPTEQFAVFSEIYFQPGWQAYLDSKPVEHVRVNYVLRGMKIPTGTHAIEFKFEPEFYFIGEKISAIGSVFMVLILLLIFGRQVWIYYKKE